MADLPIVYETDEEKIEVLYRVVGLSGPPSLMGGGRMVRKVSDLIKAHPEILVMRDTYGANLMRVLCVNPATFHERG